MTPRILVGNHHRHQPWVEWAIAIPIILAAILWVCYYAPDDPPAGSNPMEDRLIMKTIEDEAPSCPPGYLFGDYLNGGESYSCWKKAE
jgi:hypothetical protein